MYRLTDGAGPPEKTVTSIRSMECMDALPSDDEPWPDPSGGASAADGDDDAAGVLSPNMTVVLELSSEANPYGVRPCGNLFLQRPSSPPPPAAQDEGCGEATTECTGGGMGKRIRGGGGDVRGEGLGPMLRRLEDSTLVMEVLACLGGQDLARLSRCSRALYVFAHHQDLWKALLVQDLLLLSTGTNGTAPRLVYRRSWKESFIRHQQQQGAREEEEEEDERVLHVPIRVVGLSSDFLYQPLLAAGLRRFPRAWLSVDNVQRLHRPSLRDFRRLAEEPNVPAVITGVVDQWPAYTMVQQRHQQETGSWGEVMLHGGGLVFSLGDYERYAREQRDDLPLYIFDKAFAQTWPAMAQGYEAALPDYFQRTDDTDLFAVVGPDERPDYRWLIMGPKRSGSSFHKDPNQTSAWNAVLKGAKKWVLFPPHKTPPGVHPSSDGLELATPVTLVEWFTSFYDEARQQGGGMECIVREGEMMFVPRGWWHLVLNLEDESVAITQNYVSSVNLPHVLELLDEQRHLISGLPNHKRPTLYERFVARLQEHHPHILKQAQDTRRQWRNREKKKSRVVVSKHQEGGVMAGVGGEEEGPAGEGGAGTATGWSFNFQL